MLTKQDLEDLLERAKDLLEDRENIHDVMDSLEIPHHELELFYSKFKTKYERDPIEHKKFSNPKVQNFLKGLANELRPLKSNKIKTLKGIIKFGDADLIAIISKESGEFEKLKERLYKMELISIPGEKRRHNGLIFCLYQVFKSGSSYDSYKSILDMVGQPLFLHKSNLKNIQLSFTENLRNYADYLVEAYLMLNHNT